MKKLTITLLAALAASVSAPALAQVSKDEITIGVLTDMSGPFSHQTGQGSVAAARMAVKEFGGTVAGKPVRVISADHQNKPDVALNIARQWLDVEGVDVIVDLASSAVALAVQDLVREKNKVVLFTGPGTDRLTNDSCSPNGVHWVYDTYATGTAMANALLDAGSKKWFFIGNDSAFGRSMVEVMTKALVAGGGKVVGEVWHPTGASDYSSFLLQARASGADVLVAANGGTDFVATIKQAREFGMTDDKIRIVGPTITMRDILALGPELAQGLHYVDAFYWNLNDGTRTLTNDFNAIQNNPPGQAQAGTYSAVRSYLQAVEAVKSDQAEPVLKKLHETKISDAFTTSGEIRVDGRMVHDIYLVRAKGPSDPKATAWDVVDLVATIPGDKAFRPLADSACPLAK
ncbi:ABC transporter substrate-binding protein [Hyphomicrobiales bacterium]|nr:ABC transporter substrate-binding protein [Hyphomicrobiales bacterium]CAH1675652.1 ABC transporter substrate-binding protein [Hyphomicrobiales bacterium]